MVAGEDGGAGPPRRQVVVGGALVATAAWLGLDVLGASPAAAAVRWRHPFTFRGGLGDRYRTPARPTHNGIDYGYDGVVAGTPIYAVARGTVVEIGYNPDPNRGFGHYVRVEHADGFRSLYAHMRDASPTREGQYVPASGLLGHVGRTGFATGNHLHLEITAGGEHTDPEPLVHGAPLATPGIDDPPPDPPEEHDVSVLYITTNQSSDGAIPGSAYFLDPGSGPLRPLTPYQAHNLLWWSGVGDNGIDRAVNPPNPLIPLRYARVPGETVREMARSVGCLDWRWDGTRSVLTGRVWQADRNAPAWPQVAIGA
ncbi:MAG: M23 family metallopeptidase [Phycicoccus sp.]